MRLIVHLSQLDWPVSPSGLGRWLGDLAELSEEGGFDGIATADHLWQHPMAGGPEANCLEAYTTLGFLAARSESLRLLTVVTGAHFRHPALLAKTVTTLDVLSGGRAWLGIGAGHYEEECDGLGIPFPPLATRYELLEDAVEVCLAMWSDDGKGDGAFVGHHVRAGRLLNVPQALQRPRPGVLIAGTGERRTLRLVARYADACSLRPGPEIPSKLDVLARHCDELGTNFERIERTCAFAFNLGDGTSADVDRLIGQLASLADLGIDTVIGRLDGDDPRRTVERVGRDVVPAVAELGRWRQPDHADLTERTSA